MSTVTPIPVPLSLPLPLYPSSSSKLELLPHDIVRLIGDHVDELSVWRLRATSRALRTAWASVLLPYLSRKQVMAKPIIGTDVHIAIDDGLAKDDDARRESLRRVSDRFRAHLAAFPHSATELRQLQLEVRDDDDIAGWRFLRRFAPQLERLELFYIDRLWQMALARPPPARRARDAPPMSDATVSQLSANTSDVWRRVLDRGNIVFPALTSLTISATARIHDQLLGIARSTPNLRDITLSCHFMDHGRYHYEEDTLLSIDEDFCFPKLERATVIGHTTIACYAAQELLQCSRDLPRLTLHLIGNVDLPRSLRTDGSLKMEYLIETIKCPVEIRCLALYGCRAGEVLARIAGAYEHSHGGEPTILDYIEELVLEGADNLFGEEGGPYPLLNGEDKYCPDFPALKRITYVDRLIIDNPNHSPIDYITRKEEIRIFELYPSLEEVIWIDDFPSDPFNPHDKHNGKEFYRMDRSGWAGDEEAEADDEEAEMGDEGAEA